MAKGSAKSSRPAQRGPLRVVAYTRVSTAGQASDGVSLADQRQKCLLFAELHDLAIVEVIEDAGLSAKDLDRPGLQRALAMLAAGEADGLLVAKLDRLTRRVADLGVLIDSHFGERSGKVLLSVSDSLDTRSAAGRLTLNILTSVSEWERDIIVERTQAAIDFKRSRSERISGRIPYGKRLAEDGKTLEDDPDELAAVDLIREMRAEGRPVRAIAAELDQRGIPTKEGSPRWSPASVWRLSRPA